MKDTNHHLRHPHGHLGARASAQVTGGRAWRERRSPLAILKSPPKQPKAVTIQARVEESVKTQLELYAEFIDASPSYVITEALKLLFRKDDDFRRWADQHANNHNNGKAKGDVLAKAV
jgi:predicted transcriptional regulator